MDADQLLKHMKLPDITKHNISNFLDREGVILETIEQIAKDFGMFGVEISFSGNIKTAYNEILSQLVKQTTGLFQTNLSKLYAILYQIDISNIAIEKAQDELPEYSLIEVVAHQIIIRELQKVLTRRYYRNINGNK